MNNCVLCCEQCNKQRKDELFAKFKRKKDLIRFSRVKPLIYLIDEANKQVFYEIKKNITGGASLVFHRYHEAGKTKIQRVKYNINTKEWYYEKDGKFVQKIEGYDANALYLFCIGQEMLCGKLQYFETSDIKKYIQDTLKDQFFGLLKVDIRVPEDKFEYFSEMCPIFKNAEYTQDVAGEYMKEVIKKNLVASGEVIKKNTDGSDNVKYRKVRKLICSLKGEGLLIKSTRLKWMIEQDVS